MPQDWLLTVTLHPDHWGGAVGKGCALRFTAHPHSPPRKSVSTDQPDLKGVPHFHPNPWEGPLRPTKSDTPELSTSWSWHGRPPKRRNKELGPKPNALPT